MQDGKPIAVFGDSEDGAEIQTVSANARGSVEHPIGAFNQCTLGRLALTSDELVQDAIDASVFADLKERSKSGAAAQNRCAVEHAVAGFQQRAVRKRTVAA